MLLLQNLLWSSLVLPICVVTLEEILVVICSSRRETTTHNSDWWSVFSSALGLLAGLEWCLKEALAPAVAAAVAAAHLPEAKLLLQPCAWSEQPQLLRHVQLYEHTKQGRERAPGAAADAGIERK